MLLRPHPDCFFTTMSFITANENHGLTGDRKTNKQTFGQVVIHYLVQRNWQEALALLF